MSFLTQPITLQSLFGQNRTIDTIDVQVVLNENTSDVLTITKQPVQQGASITDHAYKEPTVLSMSLLFKDNISLFSKNSQIYQQLLDLQNSRVPFVVTTPKRVYRNMLLATLGQTTDKTTENCLAITMSFQEVIIVNVTTVFVNRSNLKNPGSNGATQAAGRLQSSLFKLFGAP